MTGRKFSSALAFFVLAPLVAGCAGLGSRMGDAASGPGVPARTVGPEGADQPTPRPVLRARAGGGIDPGAEDARAQYFYVIAQLALARGDLATATGAMAQAVATDPDSVSLRVGLAQLLVRRGDVADARTHAEAALARDPDNLDALTIAANVQAASGQTDQAIEAYRRILARDPEREEPALYLGTLLAEKGDLAEAERVLGTLVTVDPESVLGHFYLGRVRAERKNFTGALEALLQTLALNPNLDAARLDLAQIYEALKEPRKAEQEYREILEANPGHERARLRLSQLLIRENQLDDALTELRFLGTSFDVRLKMGLIHFEQRRLDDAAAEFALALATRPAEGQPAPDYGRAHYYLGVVEAERKAEATAETHFRRVPPSSDAFADSRIYLGYLLERRGEAEKAEAAAREGLAVKPDHVELRTLLATIYEEQKRYADAARVLEEALSKGGEDERILYALGVVYEKAGDRERGLATMQRIIAKNPRHANALNFVGYTWAEQGIRLDEAEALIVRALAEKPDDGFITDSLGWVYYQKGDYTKAVELLERAVRLAPEDAVITEHLGDAYAKARMYDKAAAAYERALSLDPAKAEVKEKLVRLRRGPGGQGL